MKSDEEKMKALQTAVLTGTMVTVQGHAVGLPVRYVGEFLKLMGGSLAVVDEGKTMKDFENTSHPFRLLVTAEDVADVEKAKMVTRVKTIVGWG